MKDLLDKTFWKFLSSFVLILVVSISLLAFLGLWREAQDEYAALFQGVRNMTERSLSTPAPLP